MSALPPGPRAPAAVQTARLLARPVELFESARRRYGEPFTLRPLRYGPMVFLSDPASLKGLFSADRVNTIAPGRNLVLRPILGRHSLLVQEGAEHLSRRRMMLPAFHGERLRAYEQTVAEVTEREIAGWPRGEPFALHPSMQAITLEVIMRAVFGISEPERRERLRAALVEILAATVSAGAIGMIVPGLRRLPPWRAVRGRIREADELLAAEIAERRADPRVAERDDILAMLVSARDSDGEALSAVELRDQLMTLLLAGHETTATALAWTFDLLGHHPAAMERLREEVTTSGSGSAEGSRAFLDAVIEESLRLRPIVPFVGRQLRRSAELAGYELPPGTILMPNIYLAHMREESFPEPRSFRPERFLDSAPETYSWVPFGGGTRRCVGAAFAQMEMRVVLAAVLGRVRLAPARARQEEPVRRNVTLSPRHGARMLVSPDRSAAGAAAAGATSDSAGSS